MLADPRLAALPALRTLAEEEARVRQEALADAWPTMDPCPPPTWASMSPAEREYLIDVEIALLSDLSRPASRDAVARLVAERLGLECGATAPDFRREQYTGARPVWRFQTTGGSRVFGHVVDFPYALFGVVTDLPGVSAITDPAEALTLIALSTLSEPTP